MTRLTLKELALDYQKYGNAQVSVCGWVRTIRDSKNFAFIELNDGTYFKSTQIIIDADLQNYKSVVSGEKGGRGGAYPNPQFPPTDPIYF